MASARRADRSNTARAVGDIKVKTVKNKAGKVTAHKLRIRVSDARDLIAGATTSVTGQHKKTGSNGVAVLTLPGSSRHRATVTITAQGYPALKKRVKL